ncbi:MAG: HprK-related kinase A [Acidobacteriota bacterium]
MKISDLPTHEVAKCLRDPGVCFRTGPFVFMLRTSIAFMAEPFRFLYGDFPLADSDAFVDFRVGITRPRGLRRWARPQALFEFEGTEPFNPMPLRQAIPLLEWGLNWCIATQAHQYLMIHAAVLERAGRALLLTAPSGAGKSTLCAALAWRGWRLLNDELALISPADGRLVPLPRPVGLKDKSIKIIRNFAPQALIGPEWQQTAKGTLAQMRPPTESVDRAEERPLPAWLVFVSYRPDSPVRLDPVPRSRAFLRFAENAFNYSLLGTAGFEATARLIDSASCYEFSYGNLDEAVASLGSLCLECVQDRT